ncbi:MAG: tRNA pseudouridine(38-40) synthase TruA [Bulleidia sp.]
MKRLKCTVSYVGNRYDGWQSQKSGNAVQDVLESIISRIENRQVSITGSGRTDAGVSAAAQVFMFDTQRDMSERKWMGAVNAFLPDDIHILNVEHVPDTFHARHCVRWKRYVYRINEGMYDVFSKDRAWQYCRSLDHEKMRECMALFEGKHDFTSLNASPLCEYPDQVRTIFHTEMKENNGLIELEFRGKGFLRYMVRMMAGTVVDVGSGKLTIEDVQKMLACKDKRVRRTNAPANGLTLEEVNYFERIAVNRNVQIREFIDGDDLPYSDWNPALIECQAAEHVQPRVYFFGDGVERNRYGYFLVENSEAKLVCENRNAYELACELDDDIRKWLAKEGLNPEYRTVMMGDSEPVEFAGK